MSEGLGAADAKDTAEVLRSTFAVLPPEDAEQATAEILAARQAPAAEPAKSHWIRLSSDGRTSGMSVGCPPVVAAELARHVQSGDGGVELSEDGAALIWTLPPADGRHARAHYLPRAAVFAMLAAANPKAALSHAEKLVVFRLVGGLSLKESAALDQLSFETKRTQLKSVLGKLDCAGQVELVRRVMTQLIAYLPSTDAASPDDAVARFVVAHLPEGCRYYRAPLPSGRTARVIEAGPLSGRPVLLLHGMLFPVVLHGALDALAETGLRVIVPIRAGYFETDRQGFDDSDAHIESALEDYLAFIEHVVATPVVLVGSSLGISYAAHLAHRRPDLAAGLVLLGGNALQQGGRRGVYVEGFFQGLRDLVIRPGLARRLTWQFTRMCANPRIARRVLNRVFQGWAADQAALALPTGDIGFEWFCEMFAASAPGVAEDYRSGLSSWKDVLGALTTPLTVVHGGRDPVTGLEAMRGLLAAVEAYDVALVPDGGHLIAATHPLECWRAVAAAAAR